MSKNLQDDRFKGITIREAVKRTVWARNIQLTVSGYSPLEIATGRRPPDLLDIETSDPAQLSVDPLPEDKTQLELQRLALRAHQEARQAADLRHDMAKPTMPSDGPYKPGDKVSFGVPLSMLTLLLQRHGRRKDGSEVLLSLRKVLWSMFMSTTQSCVSKNQR